MFSLVWLFLTPWTVARQTLCPWNFPARNIRMGCHFLLHRIFQPRGRTWVCCVCWIGRWISLPLCHQKSPRFHISVHQCCLLLCSYMLSTACLSLPTCWKGPPRTSTLNPFLCRWFRKVVNLSRVKQLSCRRQPSWDPWVLTIMGPRYYLIVFLPVTWDFESRWNCGDHLFNLILCQRKWIQDWALAQCNN